VSELTASTTQPGTVLTKFSDPLRIPPTLRPSPLEALPSLTVRMRTAQVKLHSQLPPTTVWAYDGHYPGPTFDVQRGQRIRVAWKNEIAGKIPVTDVYLAGDSKVQDMNDLGLSGGTPNPDAAQLPAWTVVHLHGGRTDGGHDGWTENAVLRGGVQLVEYPNDQAAAGLWYHDHAMGVTRFNVMAGLAGMYLIRDDEEAALNLPSGKYEVPLIIQDANVTTAPNGAPTGNLLHKNAGPLPFFGPLTLVNGVLWPYLEVKPRWYRFRMLNASVTRTYRLVLLDQNDQPASPTIIQQIGTDQGLLPKPLPLPEQGLVLAPAERADVLIDFRGLGGQSLRLVSTAGQPFNDLPLPSGIKPGQPNRKELLPEPDVMQFRVSHGPVTDPFTLPTTVSRSFVRFSHDTLPKNHEHRLVVLTQNTTLNKMKMFPFELWEMKDVTGKHPVRPGTAEDSIIQIQGPDGKLKTYQRQSRVFLDTVNFMIELGTWEQWRFLNLGANPLVTDPSAFLGLSSPEQWNMAQEQLKMLDPTPNIDTADKPSKFVRIGLQHPMHIHLERFQALSRDIYDITGFNPIEGGTERPITFKKPGILAPNEQGWKDTIRVGAGGIQDPQTTGEMVSIAARFSGGTGQFMYHCHLIGHEDEGMMRPFLVAPAEVMKLDPTMGGHGDHGMPM
jgi:FtsP/CotA-like multicopper oxidase with cupredoxin domain